MGLSKKLGVTAQKAGLPATHAVPYKWSNQTYTVEEILKKFKLPCVVQCATDSCTVVWSDFQFDLRQPLLFYSKRSVQKVHAVSLKQGNEILEEIGPPLTIPEDYEGWFGAAPKGVSKAKRHLRIEGVANSTTGRFLVTTKCPGFTSSRGPDGGLKYVPHDVMPGEILKRVCVMESHQDDSDCPELVKLHGPCLECLDEKGEDVIIPLSYAAMSYEVAETYPDDESRVFQITSPIETGNSQLPRIVTLIHGDPPFLAYAFTNMIRCYSIFTEETILAGTLEDPGSRCLELATDSCVKFRLGLNEAAVKKTCEYNNAFQMCDNFGAKFITGIKVSFTLKPEITNVGDMDVTPCESISDMQEVEANSEFDIAWGSVKNASLTLRKGNSTNDVLPEDKALIGEITHKEPNSVTDYLSEAESEIIVSDLPQHRDFTEQEIVNLMLKKGLVDSSDSATESTIELDVLKDNRVIDNPLFYFFQRNPEQNPWKSREPEDEESSSDESQEKETSSHKQVDQTSSLAYLFPKAPAQNSSTPEAKNPLSYLFEQHSDQRSTGDKLHSKILPENNLMSSSPPSPSYPEQHKNNLTSESSTDISRYDQVVRKPAKVYTGNDDEDSEEDDDEVDEESGDESSDSNEVFSDISEMYDKTSDLYYSKSSNMPTGTEHILTGFNARKNYGQENSAQSLDKPNATHTDETFTMSSGDLLMAQREEIDLVSASDDEIEAVDDLLTLAARESSRDSTMVVSGNPNLLKKYDKFGVRGSSEIKDLKTVEDDSVQRVNSLLEEVSDLVNTSSGRILDANKGPLNQDKTGSPHAKEQHKPLIIPRLNTTKVVDRISTYPNAIDTKATDLANTGDKASKFTADERIQVNKSEHQFDKNLETDEFKFNSNKVFSFQERLNKSRPEDSLNVLRRSHAEVNLAHVNEEKVNLAHVNDEKVNLAHVNEEKVNLAHVNEEKVNDSPNFKTLNELRTISPSESSISSIFSVVGRQRKMFDSSKPYYQPHDHHHRHSSEIEHLPSELSSPNMLENEEHYQFPYKNQRILSLTRGNVLASVQNFERLHSTTGSSSSNYSSSLNNSFVQDVPKFVVIGDTNLLIGDRQSFAEESDEAIYTHRHQMSSLSSEDYNSDNNNAVEDSGEVFRVSEHYVASKTGKFKPSKLSLSQEVFLQIQNEETGLQEDYV